jgi:hypothetical protein
MLALLGEFRHHGLARARRRELALLEGITVHADVVGHVQPVLENAHLRAFDVTERFHHVGFAVAIGVAQRGEPIAAAEIDVSVGGDIEVSGRALAFLNHHRGESRWQRQAIGVRGRGRGADRGDEGGANYSSYERDAHVPVLEMSYFGLRRGCRSTKVECTAIEFVGESAGEYCVRIRGNATARAPRSAGALSDFSCRPGLFCVMDFEVVT